MDVQPESATNLSSIALALKQRRERMQALSAAQRERLSQLESRIIAQLDRAGQQLSSEREATQLRRETFERGALESEARSAALAARATELERLALDLDRRTKELTARERRWPSAENEGPQQFADQEAELSRRERTIENRLAEIERQEDEIARQLALHTAGRETARQLQRDTEQELAQRQTKLDAMRQELTAASAKLAESERAVTEQREATTRELSQLRKQADERQQSLEREAAELATERARLDANVIAQRQSALAATQEREALQQEMALLKKRTEERLAALEHERAAVLEDQERTQAQRRRIAEQFKRERALEEQIAAARLVEMDALASQGRAGNDALVNDLRKECEQVSDRLRKRDEQLSTEITAREQARAEYLALAAEADAASRARMAAESTSHSLAGRPWRAASTAQCAGTRTRRAARPLRAAGRWLGTELGRGATRCRAGQTIDDRARRPEPPLGRGGRGAQRSSLFWQRRFRRGLVNRVRRPYTALRNGRSRHSRPEEEKRRPGTEMRCRRARRARRTRRARRSIGRPVSDSYWPAWKKTTAKSPMKSVARSERASRTWYARPTPRCASASSKSRNCAGNWPSSRVASATAVETAAAVEFLDKDELLKAERARIQELQAEWESKLRKAEIDISLERAQIARAQADLAERQRTFDENGPAHDPRGAADGTGKSKKAPRGRWLSRLGLSDEEQ